MLAAACGFGGQEQLRLYLKPGEVIRSPLIALVAWEGSDLGCRPERVAALDART